MSQNCNLGRIVARTQLFPHRLGLRQFVLVGCLIANGLAIGQTVSPGCDWPHEGAGPFDFRVDKHWVQAVEKFHFTPRVESLLGGQSGSYIGADIHYMLGKVPNHHRALVSLMRLADREKTDKVRGAEGRVECYFERAVRFRPDDAIVRMIYATFLSKVQRESEAVRQLEFATQSAGDNPFTHFNIGLVYFDLRNYERALIQAHKALSLGNQSLILRDQLMSVGKWTEPPDSSANRSSKDLVPSAKQSSMESK